MEGWWRAHPDRVGSDELAWQARQRRQDAANRIPAPGKVHLTKVWMMS
jgi:hypothetical protein